MLRERNACNEIGKSIASFASALDSSIPGAPEAPPPDATLILKRESQGGQGQGQGQGLNR